MTLSNFNGDQVLRPFFRPQNEEELINFVKTTDEPITVVAGRRSFGLNLQSDGGTTFVILDKLKNFTIGEGELTVQPGVTFSDLAEAMVEKGWVLLSYPAVTPPTIIGSISTNVHGSGETASSNHVLWMKVLTADGTVQIIDRTSPDWGAWDMSMGDIGIILEATLKTEPLYALDERWDINKYGIENAINDIHDFDSLVIFQNTVIVHSMRKLEVASGDLEKAKKNITPPSRGFAIFFFVDFQKVRFIYNY